MLVEIKQQLGELKDKILSNLSLLKGMSSFVRDEAR
jgi:hypothetical protein